MFSPWLGISVSLKVVWLGQGCRLHLWSGHIQEATNECIHKWNNKWIFLFLSPPPSFSLPLKWINFFLKKKVSHALSGVAQLVGHCPTKQKVMGSIPGQGCVCEATNRYVSLTLMFLPLSPLPFPLSKNKKNLLKRKKIMCSISFVVSTTFT